MEIDSVKLSTLEKIYQIAKESSQGEDIDLGFTYIVGSCFPKVFQNVQKKLADQYMKGYMEGYKDGKDSTN